MAFILSSLANCMLEYAFILTVFVILKSEPSPKHQYALSFIPLFGCACVFTFVDSFLFSILPLNYCLLFVSLRVSFYSLKTSEVLWNSLIGYLLLIYLQVIFVSVYPTELMGTHTGNFLANGSVLVCVGIFAAAAKRFGFREYYQKHRLPIRVFFLTLCLPEFLVAQFFVSMLDTGSKIVMLCFLLVQFLYVALLLLALMAITHRQERRQFADTKQHIETLNQALDDSKQSIHDFNKHIRYLQSAVEVHLQQGQYAELEGHVRSYCEELLERTEKEEAILHLDDPVLRALLYRRRLQAKATGIELCVDVPTALLPSFPLKNYQTVELFDNLTDNAFECVETLSSNRWVRIILSCEPLENGRFRNTLCVQNPYESIDVSAILRDKPYSSKSGAHQGVGLKKVTQLVDSTDGTFVFNHENHVFSVKIVYEG